MKYKVTKLGISQQSHYISNNSGDNNAQFCAEIKGSQTLSYK